MKFSSWLTFCAYIGLLAVIGVMRVEQINLKSQLKALETDCDTEITILYKQDNELMRRSNQQLEISEVLAEQGNQHGIDIAKITIMRTSSIEEVDKIVQDAIMEDNLKEMEYNSLVAESMMRLEENVQLLGQLKILEKELVKQEVLKELKKKTE
jgi:hypothetical protein